MGQRCSAGGHSQGQAKRPDAAVDGGAGQGKAVNDVKFASIAGR